jgi:hypothetical protein
MFWAVQASKAVGLKHSRNFENGSVIKAAALKETQ